MTEKKNASKPTTADCKTKNGCKMMDTIRCLSKEDSGEGRSSETFGMDPNPPL